MAGATETLVNILLHAASACRTAGCITDAGPARVASAAEFRAGAVLADTGFAAAAIGGGFRAAESGRGTNAGDS